MLGDWVDAESLQPIITGVIVVLGMLAMVLMWVVRKLLLRLLLLAIIGTLAVSLWLQRADLQDCVQTCSCRLFGQEVAIPADANPTCA